MELRQQVVELQAHIGELERNFSRVTDEKKNAERTSFTRESELSCRVSSLVVQLEHALEKIEQQGTTVKKLEQQVIDTPLIPRAFDKLSASNEGMKISDSVRCEGSVAPSKRARPDGTAKAQAKLQLPNNWKSDGASAVRDHGAWCVKLGERLPLYERVQRYRESLEGNALRAAVAR